MTLIEFFDYLVAHDATRELAHKLADAWAESEGTENPLAA